MHDVQLDVEIWQAKQLSVHVSQLLDVEFSIVPYGQLSMHALLYKIPVRQDLQR
jgi:hypothetical protein